MTKTDQVATITQLKHEISQTSAKNSTVNLIDPDYEKQKNAIIQEDILNNNNEIKGGVLTDNNFSSISESCMQAAAAVPDKKPKYSYFGYDFEAKLKWGNITGIAIIHLMFVYIFICQKPLPSYWQTYLWGKPKYSSIFSIIYFFPPNFLLFNL